VTLAHPALLWLACASPAVVVLLYLYDSRRRAQLTARLGDLAVIARVIGTSSPERRAVKAVLAGLGLALVLFALARPQIAGKQQIELRGLDVVIAVDVSKSMLVQDVGQTMAMVERNLPPDRLGRARELAVALIDELAGDRIGPVVFAGAASRFPVTEDHEVAASFLYDLGPADLPPGSNVAEVFRVSRCLLRPDLYDDLGCARLGRRGHGGDPLPNDKRDAKPKDKPSEDDETIEREERGKAIVVLTDGGEPGEEALHEVATAHELGIAVFVVGFGSTAGGPVHDIDDSGKVTAGEKHAADGTVVVSKRDDLGMKALAAAGGDERRYFIASERGEVDPRPIASAMRVLASGVATRKVDEPLDVYQPFLFVGLLLLVIDAVIGTRRGLAHPEVR
jgi:Ca-activated chloride channel family protein